MADFLLEIFSEEIPARMQQQAASDLQNLLVAKLQKEGITIAATDLKLFVTPRRLALIVKNLPTSQAATQEELKGPKVGAPEAALQGFLKKGGLSQSDLVERDGVYFATVRKEGRNTADSLKPVIESILTSFPWPKSMRWGSGSVTWVRPLHSILCLFDGKIVPVEFGGVKADNTTYGHRFHAPTAIPITSPEEYETKLKTAFVLADFATRKAEVLKQAQAAATTKSLTVRSDERLLDEVTGLVEWPTVLVGKIDDAYMDLPPEVLISEMRAHQKYFALQDSAGKFSPYFLITSNNKNPEAASAIIAGNERVLRARLSDGRFFWDQDRKTKLDDWAKKLEGITFHAKIGTLAQKVERVSKLASAIAGTIGADVKKVERAAALCKADLTTGMVGEFPDLQGVMGRYYALQQKESTEVADAIRDHYLPLGPDSAVPTEKTAICVALADKLDTLVSMFAAGEKPTGSKDPFALRRAALGILRIITANNVPIYLDQLLTRAAITNPDGTLTIESPNQAAERLREIKHFFLERFKVLLRDEGIRHDIVEAAINLHPSQSVIGLTLNPILIRNKAFAIQSFLSTNEGTNLLAGAKRAQNIVAAEAKKDKKQPKDYAGDVDAALLKEAEEKALYERLQEVKPLLDQAIKNEDFAQAMETIAALRVRIDAFFDKVLVNDPDAAIRANRLRLLTGIDAVLSPIADFSRIESA